MSDSSFTALGSGGEFDLIRSIWRRMGDRAAGLGDDAAIVTIDGAQLAITADLSVEGTHFQLDWLAPDEIGWRAAAGAISDLAAVAAEPAGVLASVGVPRGRGRFLEQLMEGITQAARAVGAVVWGGDLVAGEAVTIDVLCIGRAPRPVMRSGAAAGDTLYVTGRFGGPAAAVAAWNAGHPPREEFRRRFAHPEPRVREAAWLRDRGARAMIDVSDGLTGDAGHLAAASGARCMIDVDTIPLVEGVDRERGASSGEEYELLVAMDADAADPVMFEAEFGIPLTRIGSVEAGVGVRLVRDGAEIEPPGGFSHF